jgi:hypothetical protein
MHLGPSYHVPKLCPFWQERASTLALKMMTRLPKAWVGTVAGQGMLWHVMTPRHGPEKKKIPFNWRSMPCCGLRWICPQALVIALVGLSTRLGIWPWNLVPRVIGYQWIQIWSQIQEISARSHSNPMVERVNVTDVVQCLGLGKCALIEQVQCNVWVVQCNVWP